MFSGVFINQWPDDKQAVVGFKIAFVFSLFQLAAFLTYLKGDLYLSKESWPLGTFFFGVCWGMDRYTHYSLNKTLKLISELESVFPKSDGQSEGQTANEGDKKARKPNATAVTEQSTDSTTSECAHPETKKDR